MAVSSVGIKKIVYDDCSKISADLTAATAKTIIQAAIKAGNLVKNVHGDTWNIDESEASVTGYKNALTGKKYRYSTEPGEVTPSFSIGQYDWETKKAFMGGELVGSDGWKRALDTQNIQKALFCLTEDDVWFIFPKCRIVARESNTDQAIAIAVKALVMEPEDAKVSSEYNFEESKVQALAPAAM